MERLTACVVANKSDLARSRRHARPALADYSRIGYAVAQGQQAAARTASRRSRAPRRRDERAGRAVGRRQELADEPPRCPASRRRSTKSRARARAAVTRRRTSSLYALADRRRTDRFAGRARLLAAAAARARDRRRLSRNRGHRRRLPLPGLPAPREPGCAVAAACEEGLISTRRFESYRRLLALAESMAARAPPHLRR